MTSAVRIPVDDLETAARGRVWAAMMNCGQTCASAERVYVARPVYEEMVDRLDLAPGDQAAGAPDAPPSRLRVTAEMMAKAQRSISISFSAI